MPRNDSKNLILSGTTFFPHITIQITQKLSEAVPHGTATSCM